MDMNAVISQAVRLVEAGRRSEAVRLLRSVVQRTPNSVQALKWLAYYTPDPSEARRAIAQVLQLAPDDDWARQAWQVLRRRKPRQRVSGTSLILLGVSLLLLTVIVMAEIMVRHTFDMAHDVSGEIAAASVSAIIPTEGVSVSSREEYYTITGDSVGSIRRALDENGLYLADVGERVIATTSYEITVNWSAVNSGESCAPQTIAVALNILYTYPYLDIPSTAPPEIPSMWSAFMRRVVSHEEQHGAIAQQCANSVADAISGLPPQPDCAALEAAINRTMAAQHQQCEAQQLQFDATVGGESFP